MQYFQAWYTAAHWKQNIVIYHSQLARPPLFSILLVPVLVTLLLLVPLQGHLAHLLTQGTQVVLQGDVLQQCIFQYCLEIGHVWIKGSIDLVGYWNKGLAWSFLLISRLSSKVIPPSVTLLPYKLAITPTPAEPTTAWTNDWSLSLLILHHLTSLVHQKHLVQQWTYMCKYKCSQFQETKVHTDMNYLILCFLQGRQGRLWIKGKWVIYLKLISVCSALCTVQCTRCVHSIALVRNIHMDFTD